MEAEQKVGAVQLSDRLRGVSPPLTRRLLITEQSSLAELHATLQTPTDAEAFTRPPRVWQSKLEAHPFLRSLPVYRYISDNS